MTSRIVPGQAISGMGAIVHVLINKLLHAEASPAVCVRACAGHTKSGVGLIVCFLDCAWLTDAV